MKDKTKKAGNRTDDYRLYLDRWKEINAFEIEELRATPPATRLRQFFTLMAMARTMNWETSSAAEVQEVRSRWNRLRKAYGV
jgi:hypothetical protein